MDLRDVSQHHPLVVYDGYCLLCNRVIRFLLETDKKGRFRFCTLEYFQTQYPGHTDQDRVMLFYRNHMTFGSDAAIRILRELGGKYSVLASVTALFPRFLREWGYRYIADRRYAWFGKSNACILPPENWKSRFLDAAEQL
jgi:predicted DCC family thiol-disulfide oxidoreductase YuxK